MLAETTDLQDINELHYHGRPALAAATHPNFHPDYEPPRSAHDPNQEIQSCYFGGAHDGPYGVDKKVINRAYRVADRLTERRTSNFRYGNHTGGKGRVSF